MEIEITLEGVESNGRIINQSFIDIDETIEWLQQLQERENVYDEDEE